VWQLHRLADLNGYLRRRYDDTTFAEPGPRIEPVIDRVPDGDIDATMYVDGAELAAGDVDGSMIDAALGRTTAIRSSRATMRSRPRSLRSPNCPARATTTRRNISTSRMRPGMVHRERCTADAQSH
jgi:hypothetical protein